LTDSPSEITIHFNNPEQENRIKLRLVTVFSFVLLGYAVDSYETRDSVWAMRVHRLPGSKPDLPGRMFPVDECDFRSQEELIQ